jgi:integrase
MTHVNVGVQEDGRPKRKTVYAKTIRELEEKCAEIRMQVTKGAYITDSNVFMDDWVLDWLETYKTGFSHNTKAMYGNIVNVHIIPTLGRLRLIDVRPNHVQKLINEKLALGKSRIAQQLSFTLKQIFEKAIENGYLTKNPANSIQLGKIEKPRKRALTDIEQKLIITADIDVKAKAFLYTLLYTGLRRGEALALLKTDFDFNNKTVTVNKTVVFTANTAIIKNSPKTEAGNRIIPLPDVLIMLLQAYFSGSESEYAFPSAKNLLMSQISFRRFWEKTKKVISIQDDITPHIFRHTYATSLYYAGVDIKTAQYLLGHKSINLTMEIYTHLDKSKTICAIDKLNNFISSSQNVVNDILTKY